MVLEKIGRRIGTVTEEGRANKFVPLSKLLLWRTKARFCWGAVGYSVEHASELFYSKCKEVGVFNHQFLFINS